MTCSNFFIGLRISLLGGSGKSNKCYLMQVQCKTLERTKASFVSHWDLGGLCVACSIKVAGIVSVLILEIIHHTSKSVVRLVSVLKLVWLMTPQRTHESPGLEALLCIWQESSVYLCLRPQAAEFGLKIQTQKGSLCCGFLV